MEEIGPKLFISYSWTSPSHEEWVLSLATELREYNVDVILDKWDLKEGQDAHVFMEKMVSDPQIQKVIIICDRLYAEKANGRSGGVGTETQIISPEIYAKQDQTKFVAVLPERDEKGNPFLPTFYKTRVYIDLSNPDQYARNFEQLLRWIYNKPQYKKPELGKKPAFLDDDSGISLQTTTKFRRAIEAIRENRPYCQGALQEYFETFAENLEKFRITEEKKKEDEFDELVIKNIEEFIPYRNEAMEIFIALARYRATQESWEVLHRFFEKLIPYIYHQGNGSYRESDFDNFKFILYELFLYAIAALIKSEKYEGVAHLLRYHYYIEQNLQFGNNPMTSFFEHRLYLKSLDYRKDRLKLNRVSLHADLLKSRSETTGFTFQQIMQADFILYIRWCLDYLKGSTDRYDYWWPETLLYASRQYGAFEVFARSQSKQYFEKLKKAFDIEGKDELLSIAQAINEKKLIVPNFNYHRINPSALMGLEKIGTLA